MVKTVVISVLIVVVGIVVTTSVILPQASVVLDRPDLATWTGLEGFLKMLPFVLVGVLVAVMIRGVVRRGRDDG